MAFQETRHHCLLLGLTITKNSALYNQKLVHDIIKCDVILSLRHIEFIPLAPHKIRVLQLSRQVDPEMIDEEEVKAAEDQPKGVAEVHLVRLKVVGRVNVLLDKDILPELCEEEDEVYSPGDEADKGCRENSQCLIHFV